MKQRSQVEMTRDEAVTFLAQQRAVICATNGLRGFPHLMHDQLRGVMIESEAVDR